MAVVESGVLFFSGVISAAMSAKGGAGFCGEGCERSVNRVDLRAVYRDEAISFERSFRISNAISTAHWGGPKNI